MVGPTRYQAKLEEPAIPMSLGTVHFKQGNPDEARRLFERALSIFETRLGPDHPDTKQALERLALLPGTR